MEATQVESRRVEKAKMARAKVKAKTATKAKMATASQDLHSSMATAGTAASMDTKS